MPLNDLNDKLYEIGGNEPPQKKEDVSLEKISQPVQEFSSKTDAWKGEEDEFLIKKRKRMRNISIAVSTVLFLIVAISGVVVFKKNSFKEENINIIFEGPFEVKGGENVKYVIRIKNNNRSKLSNAELNLNYAENFKPNRDEIPTLEIINDKNSKIAIGEIPSRGEKQIFISGRFYAPQDFTVYLKAKMTYSPGNYSARYEMEKQEGIKTISASVFAELTVPSSAADGDSVAYVVEYQNSGGEAFTNARVEASYPEGFRFESSDPKPSKGDNIWDIGNMESNAKGKITIYGSLRGREEENKLVKVSIGKVGVDGSFLAYSKSEKGTSIFLPPLSVILSADGLSNGSVDAGNRLRQVISFKNNGKNSLRDLIVRLEIKSRVLDFSRIDPGKGGYYDGEKNTITWKYSEIPELALIPAGADGQVSFSVPVLENIPVNNESDKNYTISSVATVDTPSILDPRGGNKLISSSPLNIKLNSKVLFTTRGYRKDLNIENFGPMPLRLGEETSYVIHWEIINVSNDISGARVSSTLPTGVKWTGRIFPTGEKITYDQRTNEIVWEVGKVPAGKGIINDKKKVSFQVSIVPQINQNGSEIVLMNDSLLTAKDDFTGSDISVKYEKKTTGLREDETLKSEDFVFRSQ